MSRSVDVDTIRKARAWASKYYHSRKASPEWRGYHPSHLASEAIRETGKRFGIGYGCEGLSIDDGREGISYLNMGDTYDTTIIFDSRTERFSVGCYGDVVEKLEAEGITIG